jgi:hypothetical protein
VTTQFFCPYLDSEVELTEEREQHITETHPDLLPFYQERIANTLADPDEVRCDLRFSNTLLFSQQYSGKNRKGRYVVVAVVTDKIPRERHWIVTAYLTKNVTQGEIIWQKN